MTGKLQVIVDTREQWPLRFSDSVEVIVEALPAADYSLRFFETEIALERKALNDLLGSISKDRDRFTRELRQLRSYRYAAIVVEGSWSDILEGRYISRMNPQSVVGSLMSFSLKYGVQIIMADNHETAGRLVESLLHNFARRIEKDFHTLHSAAAETMRAEAIA